MKSGFWVGVTDDWLVVVEGVVLVVVLVVEVVEVVLVLDDDVDEVVEVGVVVVELTV